MAETAPSMAQCHTVHTVHTAIQPYSQRMLGLQNGQPTTPDRLYGVLIKGLGVS